MNNEITDLAHQRGQDGELLPVEKTVEVRGEGEATVEVFPATAGQRREWQRRLDNDEGDELSESLQTSLFDEFLPYEPSEFGNAETWFDIRPALEDALANAIFSELFDTEHDDFSDALTEAMESIEGNPPEGDSTP